MKKLSKLLMVAFAVGILALGTYVVAQEVSSQNVVGFVKVPLGPGWNLISLPMQKVATYTGTILNNSGNNINVSDTPWAAGQFNWGVLGQESAGDTNSYFYIEITDTGSAFEGRHMYIDSNTASALTIRGGMPSDIDDNDLDGATFKIVAALRIRDIFGERKDVTDVPLVWNADIIYTYSGGWESPITYTGESGPPPNHHRYLRGSDEVSDLPLDRDEALFIYRSGDATNLTVSGEVAANNRALVVNSGWTLIGGDVVVSEIIGQTFPSNSVKPNTDLIYAWDGGWQAPLTWTGQSGPSPNWNRWLMGPTNVAAEWKFEMSKGYFINMSSNFVWSRSSPIR